MGSSDGTREYKSFFKTVGGNEGTKCKYSTRLDTYGCGCSHDCSYCYAKSLLAFRNLWVPGNPAVADIQKVKKKIKRLENGQILRLGGMTDCFQPCEREYRVTYETIKALNDAGIGYLIVTKSSMVADDMYMDVLDKNLAHIQVTVTTTDDNLAATYEKATPPSLRVQAIEKLQRNGYDVAVRLSPLIPEYVDFGMINAIDCEKIQVEFLRANTWVKKWFDIDYSPYTVKQSGYEHLPLDRKIELLQNIHFPQVSVCEDESAAYEYWKEHVNPNKDDCCNLRVR